MPIASCGFPFTHEIPGSDPPEVVTGSELLREIGPTTFVEVAYDPVFTSSSGQFQRLVGALIDTGASDSCIDVDLAEALQLPLIDRQEAFGIGGRETFNVYLVHVRIAELGLIQPGAFMGVRLQAGGQLHRALLGRTFLQDRILVYDGRDGSVRLAV